MELSAYWNDTSHTCRDLVCQSLPVQPHPLGRVFVLHRDLVCASQPYWPRPKLCAARISTSLVSTRIFLQGQSTVPEAASCERVVKHPGWAGLDWTRISGVYERGSRPLGTVWGTLLGPYEGKPGLADMMSPVAQLTGRVQTR